MQNMMLQLNVPGKMIQQAQPQPAGGSGKTAKKDNNFRNLLENSSEKNAPKEASSQKTEENDVLKAESGEKSDNQQTQGVQDSAEKKTDSTDRQEEPELDANPQVLQFLMMGSSHPETLQVISGTSGTFTEIQPETDGPQISAEDLTEGLQTEWISGEEVVQTRTEETAGAEEMAQAGQIAQADRTTVMSKVQSGAETALQNRKLEKGEVSERKPGKAEVQQPEGHSVRQERAERTVRQASSQENQGQEKSAGEEIEHFSAQTYAAETVFQQDTFVIQTPKGTEMAPVVHIQAESPQELMNQLMDQLKAKAVMGNQEFEIQIHPENLGRLAIKVAYTLEKVSISIVCTNERTMEMLSAGAKNIAQIMEENLGAPTTVVVDQGEDNYLEQYNNQENSRQQQETEQEKRQAPEENNQDFLQQLRLGLI